MTTTHDDDRNRQRVRSLGLFGLLANWDLLDHDALEWVSRLLDWEEAERQRRSLDRRLRNARLGTFKPLADFDWSWPARCDRDTIDDLLSLRFIDEGANAILLGTNGVGKTTIARNICHQAVLAGHTVHCITASQLLNDLAAQDGASGLERRLRSYAAPRLLSVDELGYLSYGNRHADLLFEVVTRRYDAGKSLLITTNKPFAEWSEVFPNASCVVTLVDRLVHKADIVTIHGDSYRLKESKERTARRAKERAARKKNASTTKAKEERHV